MRHLREQSKMGGKHITCWHRHKKREHCINSAPGSFAAIPPR